MEGVKKWSDRTPIQLYKWGRRDSPLCPKCQLHQGTRIHTLWKCPKLVGYWNEVVEIINVYLIQLLMDLVICLLGGLVEELYPPSTYVALTRLQGFGSPPEPYLLNGYNTH